MTLHQLKLFQTVAKHLNITKAGEEIRISQPSVSKQLKQLEDELGVKLHFKIGQGIQLTNEGLLLQETANEILSKIEGIQKTFGKGRVDCRRFSVGGAESPSISLLPEVIKAFQQTHPAVEIVLRTGNSLTIEELVEKGEIEIGLVTTYSRNPAIIVQPFCVREAVAVVSPKHPLAKKVKLKEADLVTARFIVRRTSRIAKQLEAKGLKLNIVMRCDSSESLKSLVEAGAGIGLFFTETVEPALRAGKLKVLELEALVNLDFRYFIIRQKRRPPSTNVEDFLELLRKWAGETNLNPAKKQSQRTRCGVTHKMDVKGRSL